MAGRAPHALPRARWRLIRRPLRGHARPLCGCGVASATPSPRRRGLRPRRAGRY